MNESHQDWGNSMTDDDETCELKDVRALRGTETRTITKWQREGWELHSQTPGTLQTKLTFRRPKPKTPWRLLAGLGAVLVAVGLVIVIGVQNEGSTPERVTPVTQTAASEQSADPSSETPHQTEASQPAAHAILTVANNEDLAALLIEGDYCSDAVQDFASKYDGRTIEFDGNIAAMSSSPDGYETWYDILVYGGDYSETSATGPAFQFRNVRTSDLNLNGPNIPDSISAGDNLHIIAEVKDYNDTQCLLFLEPVSTSVR